MALITSRTKKTPPLIALISAYLPALILLAAVGAIQLIKGIPVGDFTRDVAAIAGVPFYTGAISTLGILFWCATASICFFTSAVLFALNAGAGPKKFAWWSGILTLILLIDDAFMVHENAPKLFGVSNSVILVIYGIVALYIFYENRSFILDTSYGLLFLSLLFLGASVVFDKLNDYHMLQHVGIESQGLRFLLEDGFKLLGIVGWLVYYGWTCFVLLAHGRRDLGAA